MPGNLDRDTIIDCVRNVIIGVRADIPLDPDDEGRHTIRHLHRLEAFAGRMCRFACVRGDEPALDDVTPPVQLVSIC